jgi:Xaa-Pro aminopeptidase
MLDSSFFAGNRRKLSKLVDGELTVVTANGLMQRSGDTVYPFRQDSNFFYLTGLKEPDLLLVIDGEDEFLVLPKKTHAEQVFGGNINCDDVAKISGIIKILEYAQGWEEIKKLQKSRKKVYTITAPSSKITVTDAFFTNGNRRILADKLKRFNKETTLLDIRSELTSLRQIKQPAEISAIEEAIKVTAEGIANARAKIQVGVTGYELKAELDYVFVKNKMSHGFEPIVISGDDTGVIHSENLARKLRKSEHVLFDIGAENNLYTADIARVYSNSRWTAKQDLVYQAVMKVHREMLKILKPGLAWRDYAAAADEVLGEELLKQKLIKRNERKLVRSYFPHAIGHSLGLDVHDACDHNIIQENMVITVEPGFYAKEYGFGMRIEDDVLITKNGVKNLSGFIPYL